MSKVEYAVGWRTRGPVKFVGGVGKAKNGKSGPTQGSKIDDVQRVRSSVARPQSPGLSPEARNVLRNARAANPDGSYKYSEEQVAAARRELLRFWGFPKKFLEVHDSRFKFVTWSSQPEGVVNKEGGVTIDVDTVVQPFTGSLDEKLPTSTVKDIIKQVQGIFSVPKLKLSKLFIERLIKQLGRNEAAKVRARLDRNLRNWGSGSEISRDEREWSLNILRMGLAANGAIKSLNLVADKSALGPQGEVRGVWNKAGQEEDFTAFLANGTTASGPYTVK